MDGYTILVVSCLVGILAIGAIFRREGRREKAASVEHGIADHVIQRDEDYQVRRAS